MSAPITPELIRAVETLSSPQLAFLAGFAWAKSGAGSSENSANGLEMLEQNTQAAVRRVTVLSASQTGNARQTADNLAAKLAAAGVDAVSVAAADYKTKQLAAEDILLLVASTQGEGEPPEEAVPLYKLLHGKKAPDLAKLNFAVLGLGDSSYPHFCQAGKDFDAAFARLGGTRLADLGLCDLDFRAAAEAWTDKVASLVAELAARPSENAVPAVPTAAGTQGRTYSKDAPFTAVLSVRQKITARSAEKDVAHIEIDLSGSGIRYQAGDALGVWPVNPADLVGEILLLAGVAAEAEIIRADGSRTDIQTALMHELDITQNTPQFVEKYAQAAGIRALADLAAEREKLGAYLAQTPPVGVLAEYPAKLDAQTLYGLFRAQTPRLYSIASSQDEVGEEVHLTVGKLEFEHHGKAYTGAASGWLGGGLEEGGEVRVFVEPNKLFRLPENGGTPVIMIGAGTGIAPFRAFMQQREADGAGGKNWLVFGNRKFTDDFLYQTEWQQYRKSGLLSRADLAWSRQGAEKVYVQHKLRKQAAEVWAWLQEGAHIYVCGDAAKMAKDVENALIDIVAQQGAMSREAAEEYLDDLREAKRYQRDVY